MTLNERIVNELNGMGDEKLAELLDFILFLKNKENREKLGMSALSESALAKDWLLPEEDEAWRNL